MTNKKSYGCRPPRYGEIGVFANPEAARIWHTRHIEPPICEPADFCNINAVDMHEFERLDCARRLFDLVGSLKYRERNVLFLYFYAGKSGPEIAKTLGLSAERIRGIKEDALCKLRVRANMQGFELNDIGLFSELS